MGTFPARWIHGSARCGTNTDPPFQVHWFDGDTVILRQNKCLNPEGPFLYLLFGRERALLLDTGAFTGTGDAPPLRAVVDAAVARWEVRRGRALDELVVAHSHGHGNHMAADDQFRSRPRTTVIPAEVAALQAAFGIATWPDGAGMLELEGRTLSVLPIPGHDRHHVAVYDPAAQLLLTGDTLYPGVLTVPEAAWASYRDSVRRLRDFAAVRAIRHVLGAHVEAKRAPGQFYAPATGHQPDERALPLGPAHVEALHAACERLGDQPREHVEADFMILPF